MRGRLRKISHPNLHIIKDLRQQDEKITQGLIFLDILIFYFNPGGLSFHDRETKI